MPKFITLLSQGRPCPLHGTGEHKRSYIFIADLCRALDLVLHQGQLGSTYNIGSDHEMSNLETVRLLISLFRTYFPECLDPSKPDDAYVTFVRDRPFNDWHYRIDSSKLRRELHWEREWTDEREMFLETPRWYMSHKGYWDDEKLKPALKAHPFD